MFRDNDWSENFRALYTTDKQSVLFGRDVTWCDRVPERRQRVAGRTTKKHLTAHDSPFFCRLGFGSVEFQTTHYSQYPALGRTIISTMMRLLLTALWLLGSGWCCTVLAHSSNRVYTVPLDESGGMTLFWTLDYSSDRSVMFEAHLNASSPFDWWALGFSDRGNHTEADFCVMWVDWKGHTRMVVRANNAQLFKQIKQFPPFKIVCTAS